MLLCMAGVLNKASGTAACLLAAVSVVSTSAVEAQTWSGLVDLRVGVVDGADPSWLEGGHGRLRDGAGARPSVGEAALVWRPRLNEALTAHVNLAY